MKFTTSTITAAAAILSLASLSQAASCTTSLGLFRASTVDATGVSDISGICNGFRDNLKPGCAITGKSCGGTNGNLHWEFNMPATCNAGHIETAWYHATKNRFGDFKCKDVSAEGMHSRSELGERGHARDIWMN